MIDKSVVAGRFGAHFDSYDKEAAVQMSICDRMASMIASLDLSGVHSGLEIGAGTGFLSSHLLRMRPSADWLFNDISPKAQPYIQRYIDKYSTSGARFIACDGEHIDGSYDLIASSSAIQWFDNVQEFIGRAGKMVNSGGYIALSLFAPNNFHEVRISSSDIGLSYHSLEEMSEFLDSAGFDVTQSWEQCHKLLFSSPIEVLRHIKLTGVNGASTGVWSRGRLEKFFKNYTDMFGIDLGVTLTYHPIVIIGKKR